MSTSKWTCRFPGCDHVYETDDYFGEAIPFLNEHGEITGWDNPSGTAISPQFIIHYGRAHKPDEEAQAARWREANESAVRIHREWFPETPL